MRIVHQHAITRALLLLCLAPFFALNAAAQAKSTAPPPADSLAWRAFHDSLAFYQKRSPKETRDMLQKELGLDNGQAATLMAAGNAFLAAMQKIDDEGIAEAKRRYGAGSPPPKRKKGDPPPVQKTVHERAIEDGLDAEVKAKKQAALKNHREALARIFGALKTARISGFVQTKVAPHVKVFSDVNPHTVPATHRDTLPPRIVRTPTPPKR